jgi:hypothetical protein
MNELFLSPEENPDVECCPFRTPGSRYYCKTGGFQLSSFKKLKASGSRKLEIQLCKYAVYDQNFKR